MGPWSDADRRGSARDAAVPRVELGASAHFVVDMRIFRGAGSNAAGNNPLYKMPNCLGVTPRPTCRESRQRADARVSLRPWETSGSHAPAWECRPRRSASRELRNEETDFAMPRHADDLDAEWTSPGCRSTLNHREQAARSSPNRGRICDCLLRNSSDHGRIGCPGPIVAASILRNSSSEIRKDFRVT